MNLKYHGQLNNQLIVVKTTKIIDLVYTCMLFSLYICISVCGQALFHLPIFGKTIEIVLNNNRTFEKIKRKKMFKSNIPDIVHISIFILFLNHF